MSTHAFSRHQAGHPLSTCTCCLCSSRCQQPTAILSGMTRCGPPAYRQGAPQQCSCCKTLPMAGNHPPTHLPQPVPPSVHAVATHALSPNNPTGSLWQHMSHYPGKPRSTRDKQVVTPWALTATIVRRCMCAAARQSGKPRGWLGVACYI